MLSSRWSASVIVVASRRVRSWFTPRWVPPKGGTSFWIGVWHAYSIYWLRYGMHGITHVMFVVTSSSHESSRRQRNSRAFRKVPALFLLHKIHRSVHEWIRSAFGCASAVLCVTMHTQSTKYIRTKHTLARSTHSCSLKATASAAASTHIVVVFSCRAQHTYIHYVCKFFGIFHHKNPFWRFFIRRVRLVELTVSTISKSNINIEHWVVSSLHNFYMRNYEASLKWHGTLCDSKILSTWIIFIDSIRILSWHKCTFLVAHMRSSRTNHTSHTHTCAYSVSKLWLCPHTTSTTIAYI